ncbi:MAG TPA: hypothetical protein VIY49_37110 [Bryobacteraceae bacterium]
MAVSNSPLSIEALEGDLLHAEEELAKAIKERLHAHEVEDQWNTEVTSLKNLIEVRRKRLHIGSPNGSAVAAQPIEDTRKDATYDGPALSHIDWIYNAVVNAGDHGLSPPEILKAAASASIKMHENYPYVALKTLVERGKVIKKEGRYYRKQ